MKQLTAILALSVLLSGCNTVKTSNDYLPQDQRQFAKPKELVFDESVSALMGLGWHVVGSQRDAGLIQAQTPMTMLTMGDVVNIHIKQGQGGKTQVDVTSASNQQYDWGKNKQNIQQFYSLLRSNLI